MKNYPKYTNTVIADRTPQKNTESGILLKIILSNLIIFSNNIKRN